jgi:hypothetical protein
MNTYSVDKAVTIRYPSTANLMIDSADRNINIFQNPYNFQITKSQSIMNGFFTRIGTTEVVLEWCQDNVVSTDLTFDISGVQHDVTVVGGTYTVADVLETIVAGLNALAIPGYTFSIQSNNGYVYIYTGNPNRDIEYISSDPPTLGQQLGLIDGVAAPEINIACPDLRPYRYIDFTCSQLTYAQDLKDTSTQNYNRDVLCRWYFADDTPEQLDAYGFPILMGYTRFCRRRIFNPPKQIKWDNNLPVGNLEFQVFDQDGNLLPTPIGLGDEQLKNNWLMTLQLSEN